MNLRPRGRHKWRALVAVSGSTSSSSSSASATPAFLAETSDAIRELLSLVKESTEVFPPLKSAVGGVLVVWDLADRMSAFDENAQALASRAVGIFDATFNAVGRSATISPGMLQDILKFEELLREITTTIEAQLKPGPFRRLLRLRKHENRLAGFISRLDAASETFKIGSTTRVELAVEKIQADVSSTAALANVLEQTNIRLRGEIQVLRTVVVLFGLSPISPLYRERECVHGARSFDVQLEEI
ncbi:hypothetical protein B0H11DRAFT_1969636 [Mycena galericulata]|nr:hypothetical protein B0H11DRAFT_1969636 [Mycena galericulata]